MIVRAIIVSQLSIASITLRILFQVLLVMPAPCLFTLPCIRFCNGPLYQNWIIQWLLVYPCQDPLLYTIASEYKSHCTGEAYMVLFLTISGCHCLTESIIPESNTGAQVWQYLQRTLRDTLEVHLLQHQCLLERWMGTPTL
jgi:hypothetical protein